MRGGRQSDNVYNVYHSYFSKVTIPIYVYSPITKDTIACGININGVIGCFR